MFKFRIGVFSPARSLYIFAQFFHGLHSNFPWEWQCSRQFVAGKKGGHNLDFGLFNGKKLSKSQTREPDLTLLMTAYAHDSLRIAKFYARQQIQIYRFFYSNAHCAVRILPWRIHWIWKFEPVRIRNKSLFLTESPKSLQFFACGKFPDSYKNLLSITGGADRWLLFTNQNNITYLVSHSLDSLSVPFVS